MRHIEFPTCQHTGFCLSTVCLLPALVTKLETDMQSA